MNPFMDEVRKRMCMEFQTIQSRKMVNKTTTSIRRTSRKYSNVITIVQCTPTKRPKIVKDKPFSSSAVQPTSPRGPSPGSCVSSIESPGQGSDLLLGRFYTEGREAKVSTVCPKKYGEQIRRVKNCSLSAAFSDRSIDSTKWL